MIGRMNLLQLLLLLLCTVFFVTILCICVLQEDDESVLSHISSNHHHSQPILIGYLSSVDYGAGLANHVYEIVSFIGIARTTGRVPALESFYYDHMKDNHVELPRLLEMIKSVSGDMEHRRMINFGQLTCCQYHRSIIDTITEYKDVQEVEVNLFHLQSFKYFSSLSRSEIESILDLPKKIRHRSAKHFIDTSILSRYDHKICVHTRRDDFITSKTHAASNELFTVPAIEWMIEYVGSKLNSTSPMVIMIGDDNEWQRSIQRRIKSTPVTILPQNISIPPVGNWHFAKLYCDSVLLTASSSTFGWWIAYLSKGQRVFYNNVFSKPGGFGSKLNPDDYFPHDWTALEFDPSTQRVGKRDRFLTDVP